MAFQPIYDLEAARVWGYEALVRGQEGQSAFEILSKVAPDQRYRFDQACRTKAIELAAKLFPREENLHLSINFLPNAVYEPAACLRATLAAAHKHAFPLNDIMFEFTENEEMADVAHLKRIIEEYRRRNFITALDDFGAGYAGLNLLADFQPDLIKIDMKLVRGIETSHARKAIVSAIIHVCRELDIRILAEGVETEAEFEILKGAGVHLFQGYWLARPEFERLPSISQTSMAAAGCTIEAA
ncbi:EAL domain-containing protein [Fulvimarina manganoxydans]|uniref:EAL domain-containing protein n=1 Tax=Fulvimarina manganoxydans TaxID=937218 RepID=UPI0030811AAB